MKNILFLILLSLVFTQELKVEGNLRVNGVVLNTKVDSLEFVIDSLQTQVDSLKTLHTEQQTLIEQLQAQIIQLGLQLGLVDCNGVFGGDTVLDECGICDNDSSNDGSFDNCGVCDNDPSNDCLQDCIGEWGGSLELDICGECGGSAINEIECYYPCLDFDCNSIEDINGNIYETVLIGDQLWMAENLKVTHYRNGDEIPTGLDNDIWISTQEGAYSIYSDDPSNAEIYGHLYNWHTVNDSRGVCPQGWHVPSDDEFRTLEIFLGLSGQELHAVGWRGTNEGAKIKDNIFWNGTNETGFSALPNGYIYSFYTDLDNSGPMHTSSEGWTIGTNQSIFRSLQTSDDKILRSSNSMQSGNSIRCIQD